MERIDAVAAPTRCTPSRNVTIGRTVEKIAIAAIQIQPPAGNESAPPITPVTRNVTAPPVAMSAASRNESIRAIAVSQTRM